MVLCRKCGADSQSKNCCQNGALIEQKPKTRAPRTPRTPRASRNKTVEESAE
jgi:hypothetical protein